MARAQQQPFVWEFQEDDGSWVRYSDDQQATLEQAYLETPTARDVQLRADRGYYGNRYSVDLKNMIQKNASTNKQRSVRRQRLPDPEVAREQAAAEAYLKKNRSKLDAVFDQYAQADDSTTEILEEGTAALCGDLGVEPEDAVMAVISWKMRAETMCVYTREEFVVGMARMGVPSVAGLRRKVPQLRALLDDPAVFAQVYSWAFNWVKDPTQKGLAPEYASAMWRLLLAGKWGNLDQWLAYIESYPRPIKKDEWDMLPTFIEEIAPDYANYDESPVPWPCLLDDFVESQTS